LASLKLRFLASLINTVIALVVVAATVAIGVVMVRRIGDRRGPSREEDGDDPAMPGWLQSRRTKFVLRLAMLATWLPVKEGRSPGYRVLGLRRVDARAGGEVSRRQELIRTATRNAWRNVAKRVLPPAKVDHPLDREKLRSEMEAARREHAEDEEALQTALMRVYQANKVETRVSCLRPLPRVLLAAAIELPVWSSLKQSLPDMLAGTVIIVDRKAQPRHRG